MIKMYLKIQDILPDRMNFYQTDQAVRQSFVKTGRRGREGGGGQACPNNWCSGGGGSVGCSGAPIIVGASPRPPIGVAGGGGGSVGCSGAPIIVGAPPPPPPPPPPPQFSKPSYAYVLKWLPTANTTMLN